MNYEFEVGSKEELIDTIEKENLESVDEKIFFKITGDIVMDNSYRMKLSDVVFQGDGNTNYVYNVDSVIKQFGCVEFRNNLILGSSCNFEKELVKFTVDGCVLLNAILKDVTDIEISNSWLKLLYALNVDHFNMVNCHTLGKVSEGADFENFLLNLGKHTGKLKYSNESHLVLNSCHSIYIKNCLFKGGFKDESPQAMYVGFSEVCDILNTTFDGFDIACCFNESNVFIKESNILNCDKNFELKDNVNVTVKNCPGLIVNGL